MVFVDFLNLSFKMEMFIQILLSNRTNALKSNFSIKVPITQKCLDPFQRPMAQIKTIMVLVSILEFGFFRTYTTLWASLSLTYHTVQVNTFSNFFR